MLLKLSILNRIKAGEITLVFRRWQRATVKAGGTLKSAVGVLTIESVEEVGPEMISENDAKRAGFADKDALLQELASRDGKIYRIAIKYAGEDPRIALTRNDHLSESDFEEIRKRLQRFDTASRFGPWTFHILRAIDENPGLVSRELAQKCSFEKDWLKMNIRKLKNIGLTQSLEVGYRISPRGKAFLCLLSSISKSEL